MSVNTTDIKLLQALMLIPNPFKILIIVKNAIIVPPLLSGTEILKIRMI